MVNNLVAHILLLLSTSLVLDIRSATAEAVLLDFSSATCGPCLQMRPVMEQLAAAGYQIHKIDIHHDSQTATRFGVTQVPTFIVLVDGREIERKKGLASYNELKQMITRADPGSSASPVVNPIAVGAQPVLEANNLTSSQSGRIVEIQSSNNQTSAPVVKANPFADLTGRQRLVTNGSQQDHRAIVEATVKITIEDAHGKSTGTGTIVDARQGEALILTCGHLFRSSSGQGPITITLFQMGSQGAQPGATYTGRLVEYDLERDLGLISIRPDVAVQVAKIASGRQTLPPGTPVASVGCNGGQNATVLVSRVTANNRYQGPGNIEVAGAPVEGRSGGGLFNKSGELVGVCFAADPQENEGLYASLSSIQTKLDDLGLSIVYKSANTSSTRNSPGPSLPARVTPDISDPEFAVRGQEPVQTLPKTNNGTASLPKSLSPVEQAALEEIQRRGVNSEVICIIRPHSLDGKSEVITLNNASPDFVRQLSQPTAKAAAEHLLR